jgi:hypothetical protein
VKGERQFRDLSLARAVSRTIGMHRVVGDRMVWSWRDMNQGSRTGKETAFMVSRRPEELCPGGDRASVVVKKRGNARGVKGGWKVETLNQERRGAGRVRLRPKRGFPLCLALQRHPTKFLLETIHAVPLRASHFSASLNQRLILRCSPLLVSVAFAKRDAGVDFVNGLID